jgi:hypothetical protein
VPQRYALEQTPYVDDLEALSDVLCTRNVHCNPPLPDTEVIKAAHSAWRYE